MTQPDLNFDLSPSEPRQRRPRVRDTSKLAVTVKRDSGTLQARAADIVHWLAWHANSQHDPPTAVELAHWVASKTAHVEPGTALHRFGLLDPTAQRNYISKGLWDAGEAVMVEAVPNGDRKCSVNQRKACTWRLRTL